MMDDTHIADGIAVKLLLAGLVLASAAVGASGLAPATVATPAADAGDGVAVDRAHHLLFPIDNISYAGGQDLAEGETTRLLFPINNISYAADDGTSRLLFPINNISYAADDGTSRLLFPINNISYAGGDGTPRLLFPINNVTTVRASGTSAFRSLVSGHATPDVLARDVRSPFRSQDMDPYGLPPGQDMDPY
jgi:hypothetical protein